jgi:hypothetical protein
VGTVKRRVGVIVTAVGLAAIYVASPVWAAFDLSLAVRSGQPHAIAHKVDWPAVRHSLKSSLADLDHAKRRDPDAPRKSLWQRIKSAAVTGRVGDNLIDRYVTPDGVADLARHRATLAKLTGRPLPPPAPPPSDWSGRFAQLQAFWNRLHTARFTDATTFEVEVADKWTPARRYVGRLKLDGMSWKLVDVRVAGVGF